MKNTYAHYCYWILSLLFSFQWEPDLCVKSIDISLDSNFTYKSNFWFGVFCFHFVRWNSNLLLFYWRLTCAMFHFEWNMSNEIQLTAKVFRKNWLFFCTISRYISCSFQSLCDFNAYLINNTSNVSPFWINIAGQHQPIIHVQLIGWCQMSYIPIAMHIQQQRKSITSCVVNWFAIC